MALALAEIKQDADIKQIEICYNPQNPVAKSFYGSFGFIEQGPDDEGEDMLAPGGSNGIFSADLRYYADKQLLIIFMTNNDSRFFPQVS